MRKLIFISLLIISTAQAQVTNRFYFPASTASAVNPAFDAAWTYNTEGTRFKLADTKGSSAITTGTTIGAWTPGQNALDRQYVSTRMTTGTVFDAGTTPTAFQMQLMTREYAANDNVGTFALIIKVVSEDGSTVRATLFAGSQTPGEFVNNATHRNASFTATATSASYTTVAGDRLVIEIGYIDGSGTTPEASAKWGENATDLPQDNTQTTDGAGWIDIQTPSGITFVGEAAGSRKIYRNN